MTENEIATQILNAAFTVHNRLGPGLLESVYEVVLAHELRSSGSQPKGRSRSRFGMMVLSSKKASTPISS